MTATFKNLSIKALEGAGGDILKKVGGEAFDLVLRDFGITFGSDDTSVQLTVISQKLDQISNQIKDLKNEVTSLVIDQRLVDSNNLVAEIEDLFLEVVSTMRSYTATNGTTTTKADIRGLRSRIVNGGFGATAEKLRVGMCGKLDQTGLLELKWGEILHGMKAIPDPIDAYLAMKTFSLHYQESLAHAMCLYKFVANTAWAEKHPVVWKADEIRERPEMEKVQAIEGMIKNWDDKLEKGKGPVIDKLIRKMAAAFLNEKPEGLQVFWDRSGGWGIGLPNSTDLLKSPDTLHLHKPRCTDAFDLKSAPFLFYNKSDATYNIRFKRDNEGWTDIAPVNFVKKVTFPFLSRSAESRLHQFQLEDNPYYEKKPPAYKLQVIPNATDKDQGIWFYIHLAGPGPILPYFNDGVEENTTKYLMRYKLQATEDHDMDVYINCDNSGQYDTEFAFRLAE